MGPNKKALLGQHRLVWIAAFATVGALACSRDLLVGANQMMNNLDAGNPPVATGGTPGTGGSDPCLADAGGIASGGSTGTGGIGSGTGGAPVSYPGTITTTPGTLNYCSGRTTAVAFSADGQLIATATDTARPNIHVWRLSDGALIHSLDGHGNGSPGSYSVAFSPDGSKLATAGYAAPPPGCSLGSTTNFPDVVKLWDLATGALLRNIPATTNVYASAAQFSPDGTRLVTGGASGAVQVWNVADGTVLASMPAPYTTYNARFSPDGTRVVNAGSGMGGVWNAANGSSVFSISGFEDEMNDAAYSPDGRTIVTTGTGLSLQFLDANGNLLQSFVAHSTNYMSHSLWVDNDHVVSQDWGGNIKSWTRDGTGKFVDSGTWSIKGMGFGLAISPDGKTLAVSGDSGFTFIAYQPMDPVGAGTP
jgi:WD40 repeat protein